MPIRDHDFGNIPPHSGDQPEIIVIPDILVPHSARPNQYSIYRVSRSPMTAVHGGSLLETTRFVTIPANVLPITELHTISITDNRGHHETVDLRAEKVSLKIDELEGDFELHYGETLQTQRFNFRGFKKVEFK